MRKRVVFYGLAVLSIVLADAGHVWAQTVEGGAKVGVNVATVTGDTGAGLTKSPRIGLVAGAFAMFMVTDIASFEPEVLYSMEGLKLTASTTEATEKVDVIQIPLLVRIGRRPRAGVANGYVLVGPAVGIIVRAKESVSGQSTETDFKDQLKSAEASLVVGGGVTISKFLIEARFTAGLTDLNKTPDPSGTNKSQAFSVLVGVHF